MSDDQPTPRKQELMKQLAEAKEQLKQKDEQLKEKDEQLKLERDAADCSARSAANATGTIKQLKEVSTKTEKDNVDLRKEIQTTSAKLADKNQQLLDCQGQLAECQGQLAAQNKQGGQRGNRTGGGSGSQGGRQTKGAGGKGKGGSTTVDDPVSFVQCLCHIHHKFASVDRICVCLICHIPVCSCVPFCNTASSWYLAGLLSTPAYFLYRPSGRRTSRTVPSTR